jgi:hypothetical protein
MLSVAEGAPLPDHRSWKYCDHKGQNKGFVGLAVPVDMKAIRDNWQASWQDFSRNLS